MLEIQESVSIEALQSIDGRNPYVTLFILNNLVNHVGGKSIGRSDVLERIIRLDITIALAKALWQACNNGEEQDGIPNQDQLLGLSSNLMIRLKKMYSPFHELFLLEMN